MEEKELLKIEGTVESVIYSNEESGFTVLELSAADELITVVGEMVNVAEGEQLVVFGNYTTHPSYGVQFRASMCERTFPVSENAILKYLSAGAVKGVGPVLARRIVEQFGEQALEVMEKHPEKLVQVRGITARRAEQIAAECGRVFGVRTVMAFLARFRLHPSVCVRVWKKWGAQAVEVLTENPYGLCMQDIGVQFEQADGIAAQLDFPHSHPFRIQAGVRFVLQHNLQNGHTCLPEHALLRVAVELLEEPGEQVEQALYDLKQNEELHCVVLDERTYWYLPEYYASESYIAARIRMMTRSFGHPTEDYERQIDLLESQFGIHYESLQRRAIREAMGNGVFILTGGPGTGKTTTINAIIELFEQMGEKVVLTAPTGRAAKRMNELTGRDAKTVHRLLEVDHMAGNMLAFKHSERNPLDADVVIVDEMSMVDTLLFEQLLRAMRLSCRLVLVGDSDQLPSVGAGNVLGDLIASDCVPTVHLREIFRQAAKSLIVTNAHRIVGGELPDLDIRDNDFFFLPSQSLAATAQTVTDLVKRRLPASYGYSPKWDIQILTPTRLGELGTVELNRRMQQELNPAAPGRREFKFGAYVFREGDKVMQIKNNYDIRWERGEESGGGIFNGDIGEITAIDPAERTVEIVFDGRVASYSMDMADELELAYAVTVHKSQGSEFEAVVIPLGNASKNLYYRNLLYTAVTRAKRLLVLVGFRGAVDYMVKNDRRTKRFTNLSAFIREELNDDDELA